MGDGSKIQWLRDAKGRPGASWNPFRGCTHASEGCRNCFAETLAARFSGPGMTYEGLVKDTPQGRRWNGKVRLIEDKLEEPFRWKRPRKILVCSTSDPFHEAIPEAQVRQVLSLMERCNRERVRRGEERHTFIVLTKRPERMVQSVTEWYAHLIDQEEIAPDTLGLWCGVSAEDPATLNARVPHLLKLRGIAPVLFVSLEPLLARVDLSPWLSTLSHDGLDWVITGGESGTQERARPCHPDWLRVIRDQVVGNGTPWFFKQYGSWIQDPEAGPYCCVCGCTEDRACAGGCAWADTEEMEDRCTSCVGLPLPAEDPIPLLYVGAKAAGNVLDGQVWEQFPSTAIFQRGVARETA